MKQETRRVLAARVASIAAGFAAMLGGANAQSIAPSAAPVEWVRYAEASTHTVSGWLQEDGEKPARLRAYFNQRRAVDGAPAEIEISLWLKPDGSVERLRFAALADAQANADLHDALIGRNLGSPPKAMLLPMRIAVKIEPGVEAGATAE